MQKFRSSLLKTGLLGSFFKFQTSSMHCSIVICTRDRAACLNATLDSFEMVAAPSGLQVEVLVVDNGSRDETAAVAKRDRKHQFTSRYLFEPRLGQVRARNCGLAAAKGEIIL